MKHATPKQLAMLWLPSLLALLPAAAAGSPAQLAPGSGPFDLDGEPLGPKPPVARLSVQDLLHAPLVQVRDPDASDTEAPTEPTAWVRGLGWKAGIGSSGFRFAPVVGDQADASVRMRLNGITIDGESAFDSADAAAPAPLDAGSDRVSIGRAGVTESYGFDLDSIEQTFVFEDLPRRGEIQVSIDVDTALSAQQQADGSIEFTRGDLTVRYSEAFAVDGNGVKLPIITQWSDGEIKLTVPAGIVENAALPLTIDPVITTWTPGLGFPNHRNPEAVWLNAQSVYVLVFEDRVTSVDYDIYTVAIQLTGTPVGSSLQALDLSSVDHRRPRLAVHAASGSLLAVSEGRTTPTSNGRIYSFPFARATTGPGYFAMGPTNQVNGAPGLRNCIHPDVGAWSDASTGGSFFVVWECESVNNAHDILGRVISADGTMGSPRLDLSVDGSNAILPRVSDSTGDPSLPGGAHNVVWIEDNNEDGRGRLWFRSVNPATQAMGLSRLIHGPFDVTEAVVTSSFSENLDSTQERPCVVGFVRQGPLATGGILSTWALPVTPLHIGARRSIAVMEDARPELFQSEIDIATDGLGFMMTYSERPDGFFRRVYMCSGGIQDVPNLQFTVTLSERHQILETTTDDSYVPTICTRFDGGVYTGGTADDGVCTWQVYDGFTEFSLRVASVDLWNNSPAFGDRPVGAQYCAAARNAGGQTGWIYAMAPNQSVNQPLRLVAEDIQFFATGYLIGGDVPGYVLGPGGSAGNLCVIGAGRYVNDVGNTGTTGRLTTTVFPTSIPQPNGPVAAVAGDTWYFQYWYRDITSSGTSTSNFTNAVAVQFTL